VCAEPRVNSQGLPPVEIGASASASPSAGRAAIAAVVLAALPAWILADSGIAWLGGWRPEGRLDRGLLGLAGLWLLAVGLAVAIGPTRRVMARFFAQLLLLAFSAAVGLILIELALGPVMARVAEPIHARRPGLSFVNHPVAGVMRDVGPEAHVRLNRWGIRGTDPPKRPAAVRILCLGGSTTACTYLDDNKTWPQLLSDDLNEQGTVPVWVGNAGLPGYQTKEHLRFLRESPLVDELDCVVVQAGINDFMAALAGPPARTPFWLRSHLWRLIHTLAERYNTSGTVVEDAAGSVYLRRRAQRQQAPVATRLPDLQPTLRQYQENIRALVEACRARHLPIVFTTQPVLWRPDLPAEDEKLLWFGKMAGGQYLSAGALSEGMRQYNDVLRDTCQELGVDVIDVDNFTGDPTIFYDDCHYTETGAERLAQQIAAWFAEHPQYLRKREAIVAPNAEATP